MPLYMLYLFYTMGMVQKSQWRRPPLSYVHSYPRTTGFLSLYYTYFKMHLTPHTTWVPCPTTKCTHTAQLRSDWWWRWRRNVSFSLSASLSLFSAPTLSSHAHLWSLKLSLKMRVSSNELFSTRDTSALCRQKSFLRQNDVLTENGGQRTDQPTGWPWNFRKF